MKYILVSCFILLLVLSSCAKLESAGYEMGKKLGSELLDEQKEETVDFECINKAQKLLSDEVILLELGDEWYLKEYSFSDGTSSAPSIRYRYGEKEGETLNYRYPTNILESNYVKFSEQVISQEDVILGDFTFQAKLILEESDDDEKLVASTKYGREIATQTYDVVEQEIINCVLPR